MIHLALTIISALFLTALAASVLWCCYVLVGFLVLGTRELCRYCFREIKQELADDWREFKKLYFPKKSV